MSPDATTNFEARGRGRVTTTLDTRVRQQIINVREALRFRRLARDQSLLHGLYDEHNLFDEARDARRQMMHLLRSARIHWRRTLGLVT